MQVSSPDESLPLAIELVEMAIAPEEGLFLEQRAQRASEALQAVVGLWERLPPDARDLALSVGRGRWTESIAAVLNDPADAAEARSAALLGSGLGDPEVAAALVQALNLKDDRALAAAELGLLGLSLRARHAEPLAITPEVPPADLAALAGPPIESLERAALDVHLADAAWAFAGHQRRLVLLAALAALDVAGLSQARRDSSGATGAARLLRLVQESSHVAHRALRQILRWSPAPLVRERALLLLAEPAIAEAALERLSRADSAEEHASVLVRAHLALRPARRRLLAILRSRAAPERTSAAGTAAAGSPARIAPGQFLPDAHSRRALAPGARANLPLLVGLIDADDQTRTAALEDALGDPDPLLRLRALAVLPRTELAHFCFDSDPLVARSALLRWSTGGLGLRARAEPGERARLASLLTRSPHAGVRHLAAQETRRETPWDASSTASRASAWRLALRERDAFLSRLRAAIRAPIEGATTGAPADPLACLRAIATSRRLGLTRVVVADLAELVDPARAVDHRVAATAAAALGDVDDILSRSALRGALEHADSRVRANAVEAIGVQRLTVEDATTGRDRDYGSLIEHKSDPDHRIRANAIRALMQSPPPRPKDRRGGRRNGLLEEKPRVYEPVAVDALGAMLRDERPAHRLAGIWLAGRVLSAGRDRVGYAWSGLSTRLAEMSTSDCDPVVRARARHAVDRLSSVVRAAWGGQAAHVEDPFEAAAGGRLSPPARGRPQDTTETISLEPVEPAGKMG